MTLGELQEIVNDIVRRGHDINSRVYVTTADSAIGGRAKVEVASVYAGFDWEKGQIRIDTVEETIKKR
jgi:hypothetical protein